MGDQFDEEAASQLIEEFFAAEKGTPFQPGDVVRYSLYYLTGLPIEEAKQLTVRWGVVVSSTEDTTVVDGLAVGGFHSSYKTGRLEKIGEE